MTVYPDRGGIRWWTKAWFNGSVNGESAVEIEERIAVQFIHDSIDKETMLNEYYPKQMEAYHSAIDKTRTQLLSQLNI